MIYNALLVSGVQERGKRRQETERRDRRQESGDRKILPEYCNKENLKGKCFIIIIFAVCKCLGMAALEDI